MGRASSIRLFALIAVLSSAVAAWVGGPEAVLFASGRTRLSVASVTLSPSQLPGGSASTGTVSLSGAAPKGGVTVTLSSGNSAVAALSSTTVVVPAGQSSANFTVNAKPVNSAVAVSIRATLGDTVKATLTVIPPQVSSISVAPAVVTGGQGSSGTVVLTSAAAAAGTPVTLSSSAACVAVPASVTVPGGSTSVSFAVTSAPVASQSTATITASFAGSSISTTLALNPPVVTALTFNPASVTAGQSATGTVTLNAIAPAGGFPVSLMSNSAAVPVPASITVAAGTTTQSFSVVTTAVSNSVMAMVVATTGTTTAVGTLAVNPLVAVTITALSMSPQSVIGGTASTGTVTLSGPAPAAGLTVTLASNMTSVATVPASINFAGGATAATFTVSTSPQSANASAGITATLPSGNAAAATLTVIPPAVVLLTFSPATVGYGQTTTGTITLNGNSPAGGFTVSLQSNDPAAVPVPASVLVSAGASSQTFTVTAGAVTSTTSVTLTATTGSTSATAMLTVDPALMASPASVVFGSGTLVGVPSAQTVALTNTAATGVTLTSIAASGDFTETNTCPATLGAGASCVVTLTPTQGGNITGNVTIASNAANSALTVNLSGTAMHWVGLSWGASSTPGVSYNVYRELQSGGACGAPSSATYARLNTSAIGPTNFNDTDPSLVAGDTYCYSVTAVDSGGESPFSSPAISATIPSP